MVVEAAIPNLDCIPDQACEVNCVPLSEVTTFGLPNLATQPLRKPCSIVSAVVSVIATASGHHVVLSIMVRTYRFTWSLGNGPTMSMWTCSNLLTGVSIGSTG